jgi:hypothetical protein
LTCDRSRDEYIQAVRNVVEATRALADMHGRMIDDLKSRPSHAPSRDCLGEWHLCTDALSRLIDEQNEALDAYDAALKQHGVTVGSG